MLSKGKLLNLKKDFVWVRSDSKKVDSKNFKIFLRSGENLVPKVGVALSSSFFKKAYQRNAVKRLVLGAVEDIYGDLAQGSNLIIIPKVGVLSSSKEDLIVELKNVKGINLFN